ncbi:MAG: branched-chain amino acid ABC transporter permease [bacterium]|nr:branched-chain amino acid ABC transporter permease [bacterium]
MSYLYTVLAFGLIYAMLALGLNLQMGFTGIINFGYVAFVAIGAYTSAILTVNYGWPIALAWSAAALLAALASYPLGLLTIRLGGDYLAVVTLGFSELVVLFILNQRGLTRGAMGIVGIHQPFAAFGPTLSAPLSLLLIAAITALTALLIWRIGHSPLGRLLRAIQANESAAQALGKNTVSYKVLVLVIGSGIAGLAGALYAHWVQYISPEQFSPDVTFNTFIALILGGVGSLFGPIVGAFVLILFLQGSIVLQDYVHVLSANQLAALRFMIVGLVLVLLILFRPNGILGKTPARHESRREVSKA